MIENGLLFRTWRGARIVASTIFLLTTSSAALAWGVGDDPPPAPAATYVPRSISLRSLTPASDGKVCVVGYSQQKTGVKIGPYDPITVPAYYLSRDASRPTLGVWKPMTSANISALEVGAEITMTSLTPAGGRYLNAGTLTFYFVKSPPSGFKCSSIFLTVSDPTSGAVGTPYYPYPRGLFEASVYPVWNATTKTYTVQTTVDTSNVDSFELPLLVNVAKVTKIVPTPPTPPNFRMSPVAYFGNPVTTAGISRRTLISGTDDKGGPSSPFHQWLLKQPSHAAVADSFLKLAYATSAFPYAMIESPNDFLNLKCVLNTAPVGCKLNNELLNLRDPLNAYFDAELGRFFTNAANSATGKYLAVMGDQSGRFASEPWIASSNSVSCPLYLRPDKKSLEFTNKSKTGKLILCNPKDQVQFFSPAPAVTVKPILGISVASDGFVDVPVPAYYANATFKVTSGQCADAQKQGRLGWNLGQPDTNFVANITKVDCATNTLSGPVIDPSGKGPTKQSSLQCPIDTSTKKPVCPQPNPSFANWLYSNIPVVPGVNWAESASQMAFANDGAFAAWQAVLYASDGDLKTVAQSVARNIVMAFSRGIANCNNVTMSPKPTTGPCAKVTASPNINTAAAGASDAFWSNETNFYPAGGVQNYYAQYLHTMMIGNTNIFLPPQPIISSASPSNQPTLVPRMGMAYGFAYDENPTYLKTSPANVPSKLDPIPSSWWPQTKDDYMILGVAIGRSN